MMTETVYNKTFFGNITGNSIQSARQMLPEVFKWVEPKSMLELGSGTGAWTMVARELGLTECVASDGSWVKDTDLLIPKHCFIRHDLEKPFAVDKKFDLGLSLEVAEHLRPSAAQDFVTSLTAHSDIVLFGAALKLQGGTQLLNEQWAQYWIDIFRDKCFVCFDVVRPFFWNNNNIAFYYKQNTFIFVRNSEKTTSIRTRLKALHAELYENSANLCFIHPQKWEEVASYSKVNPATFFPKLPTLLFVVTPKAYRHRIAGKLRAIFRKIT